MKAILSVLFLGVRPLENYPGRHDVHAEALVLGIT